MRRVDAARLQLGGGEPGEPRHLAQVRCQHARRGSQLQSGDQARIGGGERGECVGVQHEGTWQVRGQLACERGGAFLRGEPAAHGDGLSV